MEKPEKIKDRRPSSIWKKMSLRAKKKHHENEEKKARSLSKSASLNDVPSEPYVSENSSNSGKVGHLMVFSSAWKKRYCVLHNRTLALYASKKDKKPAIVLDLHDCNIKPYSGEKKYFCFQIFGDAVDQIFGASSQAEMDEWMRFLEKEIREAADKRKEIENQLVKTKYQIPAADLDWSSTTLGRGASGLVKKGNFHTQ